MGQAKSEIVEVTIDDLALQYKMEVRKVKELLDVVGIRGRVIACLQAENHRLREEIRRHESKSLAG